MKTSSFLYKYSFCNTTNGTVNDSANEVVDSEIWKDIEGYEGLYQVSNLGRVKSLKNGRKQILKSGPTLDGYLFVVLCENGKKKTYLIHRLVAKAFIPNDNPEYKTQVNHINEIVADNRACNLNWITPKENVNWGTRNDRMLETRSQRGCRNAEKKVIQMALDNRVIKIWPSTMEAERNGYASSNISSCCNGHKKTYKGFKWAYLK